MGCFTLYLVPTTAVKAPRQAALDAAAILVKQGILSANPDGEFDSGHWNYGMGEKSEIAFAVEANAPWPAFETCYLFGDERPEVVPQDPAVAPSCPKCSADVADAYYEFINDENEHHIEEPFRCPECGHTCRLDELKDEVGIFIVNFYVSFDDTNGSQLKPEWLQAFSRELGIQFAVKEYWWT